MVDMTPRWCWWSTTRLDPASMSSTRWVACPVGLAPVSHNFHSQRDNIHHKRLWMHIGCIPSYSMQHVWIPIHATCVVLLILYPIFPHNGRSLRCICMHPVFISMQTRMPAASLRAPCIPHIPRTLYIPHILYIPYTPYDSYNSCIPCNSHIPLTSPISSRIPCFPDIPYMWIHVCPCCMLYILFGDVWWGTALYLLSLPHIILMRSLMCI